MKHLLCNIPGSCRLELGCVYGRRHRSFLWTTVSQMLEEALCGGRLPGSCDSWNLSPLLLGSNGFQSFFFIQHQSTCSSSTVPGRSSFGGPAVWLCRRSARSCICSDLFNRRFSVKQHTCLSESQVRQPLEQQELVTFNSRQCVLSCCAVRHLCNMMCGDGRMNGAGPFSWNSPTVARVIH